MSEVITEDRGPNYGETWDQRMGKEPVSSKERLFMRGDIVMLLGWMSGEIPELRSVETPRLLQALDDWMKLPVHECGPTPMPTHETPGYPPATPPPEGWPPTQLETGEKHAG